LSSVFRFIGRQQLRFHAEIIIIALIITVFLGFNALHVEFESDFSEEMPAQGPVFEDTLFLEEGFSGSDSILITYELDKNIVDNPLDRITEKKVIESMYELDGYLREMGDVKDTENLGEVFKRAEMYPWSQGVVDDVLAGAGDVTDILISDDKKAALFIIYVDRLEAQEDVDAFVEVVEEKIARSSPPYGVETRVSGNPVLMSELQSFLESDYFTTIALALLFISIFVYMFIRAATSTVFIMLPIVGGLIWYIGFIHLLGLKLSVSTIATGAMIVGLGVEYSIFIFTKLKENYNKKSKMGINERLNATLEDGVGFTGRAIFGSALTTAAAFFSLTMSQIPLIANLGIISAIGIVSILFLAVFVNPCVFVLSKKIKQGYNE